MALFKKNVFNEWWDFCADSTLYILIPFYTVYHFYILPILTRSPTPPHSLPAYHISPPSLFIPPLWGITFSLQHLSLLWNKEEMPPFGLTSGPSWRWAVIDTRSSCADLLPSPTGDWEITVCFCMEGVGPRDKNESQGKNWMSYARWSLLLVFHLLVPDPASHSLTFMRAANIYYFQVTYYYINIYVKHVFHYIISLW